jgi:hypothetical protein
VETQQFTDGLGLHPSGLTWQEWNYPFKNDEQMVLVAAWYKYQREKEWEQFEPSPF